MTKYMMVKDAEGKRRRIRDLRGESFGHLRPSKPFLVDGELGWFCVCDCGNKEWVLGTSISRRTNMACSECKKQAGRYNQYRQNSKRDDILFDMTLPEFKNLITSEECYVCGSKSYMYLSVLDVDAERVLGNCVPTCSSCREIETLGLAGYIEKCRKVADKWKES